MKFFDWLRPADTPEPDDGGMSRRDFFARVAGREGAPEDDAAESQPPDGPESAKTTVLYTFHIKSFPYHAGPVLVPIMRIGDEFRLTPDPPYSRDPTGVRIERGRDHLGFVPDEHSEDVLTRLKQGEVLVCRATHIDPSADLANIVTVEIEQVPPADDPPEEAETHMGTASAPSAKTALGG